MTRINLLDWRAKRREQRRQRFIAMMTASVVLGVLVFGLGFVLMSGAIGNQRDRNEYLRQQIVEVDQKIREIEELDKVKNNLLARMAVIEELQASRAATVHFFDELVNTLPEGVTLTGVKQAGSSVTIDGAAESNGRVSSYMKNLDASLWFDDPRLVVIKTADDGNARRANFTLRVKVLTRASQVAEPVDDEELLE